MTSITEFLSSKEKVILTWFVILIDLSKKWDNQDTVVLLKLSCTNRSKTSWQQLHSRVTLDNDLHCIFWKARGKNFEFHYIEIINKDEEIFCFKHNIIIYVSNYHITSYQYIDIFLYIQPIYVLVENKFNIKIKWFGRKHGSNLYKLSLSYLN